MRRADGGNNRFDERRKYKNQIELKGLAELTDLVECSKWAIKEKIEQVFGVTIDE